MAGIYIHIPFCKQACTYCNFHFSTSLKMKDELLDAILYEIASQKGYLGNASIETIYFGGGTPSLLSADEISRVLESVHKHYNISPDFKELTLEANPDDLTKTYLNSIKNLVGRLSIGIQSFRDEDLKYMNRAHNAQQADAAVKAAQDAGITNLTIDLIYGTPGLSDKDWLHNLSIVKQLQVPHFSSYALTVEEGTALHHNIAKKKTTPVDAEQSAAQFEILMEQAPTMGFEQYEISNFALPGKYAVHNTNYWKGIPYLGIGPSAHSFNGTSRRWNMANNALYIKGITDNQIIYEEEVLTPTQQLNEYIMTSLRTMWGMDLQNIAAKWGIDYKDAILNNAQQHIAMGNMVEKEHHLILTNKGKLLADGIAADLFF
ncbi:MAG: radical SAM family heme chaperone HemW [Bacteroidetes bacterium]|nr:radical SAM family heme chaperone HemW [Bacteroidota bacterium]